MKSVPILASLLLAGASTLAAGEAVIEYEPPTEDYSYEFLETFQDDGNVVTSKKWVQSKYDKYSGQQWVQTAEFETVSSGIPGDKSLVINRPHKHYGLVHPLKEPVDPTGKDLVIQYEVRFHKGIRCSGAYLKLLVADDSFKPEELDENSPYSIMFGPDKCGDNAKVHVIFRVQNKLTKEWEEKHMSTRVKFKADSLTHGYTLVVSNDDTFTLYVDGDVEATGSLLSDSDFTPPFQPPEMIDDPEDKKPSDWVEEAKIVDPEAKKPDDWDEDAPKEIEDPSAEKPAGWEDDEPLQISDPEASEPEDWDEEEDGKWMAPLIKNPKCTVGCGEWKRPMIKNPNYKGKWIAPKIDNPDYKGPWAPKKIENPGYYPVVHASDEIAPIGAVAIEVLANEAGIAFDNIFIGHNMKDALLFLGKTQKVKANVQKEEHLLSERQDAVKEMDKKWESGDKLGYFWAVVLLWFRDYPQVSAITILGTISVTVTMSLLCCCEGNKSEEEAEYETYKKTDGDDGTTAEVDDDAPQVEEVEDDEEEEEEEEPKEQKPRRRRTPKAD